MCAVSMITDHYRDRWTQPPYWPQEILPPREHQPFDAEKFKKLLDSLQPSVQPITKEEIEEFRRLLERAREYDKRNNEPECELDEKRTALLAIANALGVEISFL